MSTDIVPPPGLTRLDAEALQPSAWRFDLLPLVDARARGVLPIESNGNPLLILADPTDLTVWQWVVAQPVRWRLAITQPGEVESALALAGEQQRTLGEMDWDADSAAEGEGQITEITRETLESAASPVIRLIDSTLFDALALGASDIHLESLSNGLGIRYRLDGVMRPMGQMAGTELAEHALSRLKILSGLDIGERRIPQDGRFRTRIEGRSLDVRVSIIPSIWGEDAVLRLLDTSQLADRLTLDTLGIVGESARRLRRLTAHPHGMMLITGPTGSGKTTTLYAALGELNHEEEKIITIEDPVEYQLAGVMQIPVNERKGLTFARGLRSILRHDPDTVLVGEIRDGETATIAIQAALTGHRVLSSIHANGVFSVIERFRFMGVEPFTLAEAFNGVVAQRLVRRVCEACAEPGAADAALARRFGVEDPALDHAACRHGKGCDVCRGSGFRGRLAILETLEFDSALREAMARGATSAELARLAAAHGHRPLVQDAAQAALNGLTTLEEVSRVVDLD
jgi:general secretion pathway protein E